MVRRVAAIFCSFLLTGLLTGCSNIAQSTEELIERARKESSVFEKSAKIQYAGMYSKDESALLWFISGDNSHHYLAMECKVVGQDAFRFIRTCEPWVREKNIAVIEWKDGYCFLINNDECTTLQITVNGEVNTVTIDNESYPYIYYVDTIPQEYTFWDGDGNKITG